MIKYLLFLFAFLLFSSFALADPDPEVKIFPLAVAIIVGVWEVVSRVIPSVSKWGVIGKVIDILAWVSNYLDRKK